MKHYLRYIMQAIALPVMVMGILAVPSPVSAGHSAVHNLCEGVEIGTSERCGSPTSGNRVSTLVQTAINIFSAIIGIAAVIMILVAGIKFVVSGGEASNVNAARSTILYAIVGLVVAVLAQVIARFALDKV